MTSRSAIARRQALIAMRARTAIALLRGRQPLSHLRFRGSGSSFPPACDCYLGEVLFGDRARCLLCGRVRRGELRWPRQTPLHDRSEHELFCSHRHAASGDEVLLQRRSRAESPRRQRRLRSAGARSPGAVRAKRVGCTNSAGYRIRLICRKIEFVHPTRTDRSHSSRRSKRHPHPQRLRPQPCRCTDAPSFGTHRRACGSFPPESLAARLCRASLRHAPMDDGAAPLQRLDAVSHHWVVRELPTGTVTFLFTDIEGSTRLLEETAREASCGCADSVFPANHMFFRSAGRISAPHRV
jgi:hypothetical protein